MSNFNSKPLLISLHKTTAKSSFLTGGLHTFRFFFSAKKLMAKQMQYWFRKGQSVDVLCDNSRFSGGGKTYSCLSVSGGAPSITLT